jgi:hypothetical protein
MAVSMMMLLVGALYAINGTLEHRRMQASTGIFIRTGFVSMVFDTRPFSQKNMNNVYVFCRDPALAVATSNTAMGLSDSSCPKSLTEIACRTDELHDNY